MPDKEGVLFPATAEDVADALATSASTMPCRQGTLWSTWSDQASSSWRGHRSTAWAGL